MSRRVWYFPLEPYEERYTLQLLDWTTHRMAQRDVPCMVVGGDPPSVALPDNLPAIETGVVLDAIDRPYWAASQVLSFLEHLKRGNVLASDVLYLADLFHPGYEGLVYALWQRFPDPDHRPRLYAHCWAQSVDVYDFTYPWRAWMRPYELMVDKTIAGIFVASTELRDLMRVGGFEAPIHVVGLPFDIAEVRGRAGPTKPLRSRKKRIVYASRFDAEKQPIFWLDLVEEAQKRNLLDGFEFAILTGARTPRSNQRGVLDRVHALADRGALTIHAGLTKAAYYGLLGDSRVQVNTAAQDWVSYTMLEASALGTPSLVPCFRGFPEAMEGDPTVMYAPWSLEDALSKLTTLAQGIPPPTAQRIARAARTHDHTLDAVIDILVEAP